MDLLHNKKEIVMTQYIDKSALVAEIERRKQKLLDHIICESDKEWVVRTAHQLNRIILYIDTLEVIDPYKQIVQYPSVKDGIQAHSETYSFNIESELFNQLTKEQKALWRKEIEEACISGGYAGYQLAKDPRYKENLKVKDVDLDKEIKKAQRKYKTIEEYEGYPCTMYANNIECIAKHFFELGIKASNTLTWEDIGTIDQLLWELSIEWSGKEDNEGYYQDVLKRFKDFKERKDGGKK